jgi:hypothetical protein
MMQPVQAEREPEEPMDQCGDKQGLACVAGGKYNCAPDVSVTEEIGYDRCSGHTHNHRQASEWPNADKDSSRNTCGRPKDGDSIGLRQQSQAQPRRSEVNDSNPGREGQ